MPDSAHRYAGSIPIDWPWQLSREVWFGRAGADANLQPPSWHRGAICLPDGRWFDRDETCWRDGHGNRCIPPGGSALDRLRGTRVIPAAAHLTSDSANGRQKCQPQEPVPTVPPDPMIGYIIRRSDG